MAELSTLSPSPPALAEPLPAPSSSALPAAEPALDAPPVPKSSLYSDKALTAHLPEAADLKSSASKVTAETAPLPQETAPLGQEVKDEETENHLAESQNVVQPNSPSPELNPAPNLYPSVQVTQNPTSENSQCSTEQPQIAPLSDSVPPKPEEDTTQPPPQQEQQTPEAQIPQVSPKLEAPIDAKTPEPPSTPIPEQSPTVPLINEPLPAPSSPVQLPNPNPRPAPDTLSYLESASLMSGTLESLSGLGEDGSSVGSDSEINGLAVRRTDKYGFLGGSQFSEGGEKDIRVEVARQREMKWLDMFNHWDKWIKHRFQKVKLRCRKGVPSSLRAKAWQLLSNSQELLDANPGKFEELEREPGEAKWLDIIEKDLHRQFPFHEMFAARGGHGQQDLYRILKAYTIYRPDEGYCQAQAPVAAVLLMHMPAEQAFWCLVQICEKYLPGYYSAGLEAIQLDGEIFFSLLRRTCPMAYRHLKKFKIDPILYMTEWFMCIFSRTLPWACVLRVWDMFFCEGVKIVFRVGLVLLKQMLGSVDKLRELQGMYETMERLRNISPDLIREDILVQEIITLPVTEALIERESNIQVRKWRESRGELTHEPGRRLHGTRSIYEYKRRAASISSGGSFSFLGSPVPPPGPLRASSSLLSLPGFRKSKANPFQSQRKKASFSGPSGMDSPPQSPPPAFTQSSSRVSSNKPPIPPGAGQRAQTPHVQSPLVTSETNQTQKNEAGKAPTQSTPPVNTLSPSPKIVSEQITPKIPSPTANNAPLPPCPVETKKEATPQQAATADATTGNEDDGKKTKKTKEDKKKEKEDEKKRLKEKKEKEKVEKERLKKEKERMEKERKRSGRKKHGGSVSGGSGGAGTEDKNGAAAAKDTA